MVTRNPPNKRVDTNSMVNHAIKDSSEKVGVVSGVQKNCTWAGGPGAERRRAAGAERGARVGAAEGHRLGRRLPASVPLLLGRLWGLQLHGLAGAHLAWGLLLRMRCAAVLLLLLRWRCRAAAQLRQQLPCGGCRRAAERDRKPRPVAERHRRRAGRSRFRKGKGVGRRFRGGRCASTASWRAGCWQRRWC